MFLGPQLVLEAEADWQAGALLVRQAALEWMQMRRTLEDGAGHFGVSLAAIQMASYPNRNFASSQRSCQIQILIESDL